MKPVYTLILIATIGAASCQKTNRGIEVEYRTDTIAAVARDTTFVMEAAYWDGYSYSLGLVNPGPKTFFNSPEGLIVKGQARYSGLRLQTKEEINFKNKVIYYKWKVNGMGDYSAVIPSIKYDPFSSDDYVVKQGVYFGMFTTERTHLGSAIAENDTWYYTRVKSIAGTNNFEAITSKNNYDNSAGVVILNKIFPVYTRSGYISLLLFDNFSSDAYAVLGECKIKGN